MEILRKPLLLIFLLLSACGQGVPASPGLPGDQPASPMVQQDSAWLTKHWEGIHSQKNLAGGQAGLTEAKVELNFLADQSFSLQFSESANAYAKGDYFASQEKIILHIKESTISSLGRPGYKKVLWYDLRGGELLLYDSNMQIALTAIQPSPQAPQADGDRTGTMQDGTLFAAWTCQLDELLWRIVLFSSKTFLLKAYFENSLHPFEASGSFTSYQEYPQPQAILHFLYKQKELSLELLLIENGHKLQASLYQGQSKPPHAKNFVCYRL